MVRGLCVIKWMLVIYFSTFNFICSDINPHLNQLYCIKESNQIKSTLLHQRNTTATK